MPKMNADDNAHGDLLERINRTHAHLTDRQVRHHAFIDGGGYGFGLVEVLDLLALAAQQIAMAGDPFELKRIRTIVDEDARKRHGDREGEPSWGVIADCVLAHVSQHRQANKILDVPDHVTLDQAATVVRGVVDDAAATRLILEASLGRIPDPARSTVQLAREVVDQTERWRVDAEHYRSEASNATSRQVESLSAEVARLTGEVAATRAEAARQLGARDADLAALITRAQRLAADLTSEANECTAHGLVSPATALRGAAAFLTSMGERVPRVFSAASNVEALHLRLEEADRRLAGLQEEVRQGDEALRGETRKVIEYSNLVDQYKLGLVQVQGANASQISTALAPSSGATALRHTLAAQLRAAAKTASAWEEAAIQEWAPLAPDYHDGDGTVTAAIEGPYIEHRLVMAWRGQVQRMADNLSADESPPTPIQRLNHSLLPLGYTMEEDVDADDVSICLWLWSSDADTDGRATRFGAECTSEADAIIDAWSDWKKSNDPPGLTVESFEDGASWIRGTPKLRRWDSPDEARAAAWAWYDRRNRLIDRGLANRGRGWMGLNPWPRCLTWTDEQVAEVERWLVDSTAEMPEVLRG